jgi:hypothetical protein
VKPGAVGQEILTVKEVSELLKIYTPRFIE